MGLPISDCADVGFRAWSGYVAIVSSGLTDNCMKLHVVLFIEVGILRQIKIWLTGFRLIMYISTVSFSFLNILSQSLFEDLEVEIRNPRLWGNILRFHKPSSSGLEGWVSHTCNS